MITASEVISICKANYEVTLITDGALLVGKRKVKDTIGAELYELATSTGYEPLLALCKPLAAWACHAHMVERIATEATNRGVYQLYTTGSNVVPLPEIQIIRRNIDEITMAAANELIEFIQARVAAGDPLYTHYWQNASKINTPSLVSNPKRTTQIW